MDADQRAPSSHQMEAPSLIRDWDMDIYMDMYVLFSYRSASVLFSHCSPKPSPGKKKRMSSPEKPLSYINEDFFNVPIDHDVLARAIPLSTTHSTLPFEADLGELDKLPVELLTEILLDIDLAALYAFRSQNRLALSVVDQIPEYKTIITAAPVVLRTALGTKCTTMTCRELYTALCSTKCSECNENAGFIYLPLCKRTCFFCLASDSDRIPNRQLMRSKYRGININEEAELMEKLGFDDSTISQVPTYTPLPGTVPPEYKTPFDAEEYMEPVLADLSIAEQTSMNLHDTPEQLHEAVYESRRKSWTVLSTRPHTTPKFRCPKDRRQRHFERFLRRAVPPRVFASISFTSYTFAITVFAPWIDPASGHSTWPLSCTRCRKIAVHPDSRYLIMSGPRSGWARRCYAQHPLRVFTATSLSEHEITCSERDVPAYPPGDSSIVVPADIELNGPCRTCFAENRYLNNLRRQFGGKEMERILRGRVGKIFVPGYCNGRGGRNDYGHSAGCYQG
ncbi:hypothetical protein K402DRAFT_397255 [Aulographum hederae CBS 113979]|uniref:F-box domain-containing protein n=1 Tax=Aulographum hederae CBS 113979 TaxID=1176131 RepID=A0A6G1GPI1_9PEZI|nr:hypothetical protein K402DRAFT_397255 [Aulographum hederae CBS 113979]